ITEQSLYQAQQVGLANGLSRFLLVSDPLHMKRAMRVASDLGMEAFPSPTPTSRYQSWRSQLGFLARETLFYLAYLAYRAMRAGAAALAALARG
ncbi:MAG: YdcF family protein, partial [Anaerolineae bacterium]|nr:YdcF family protein [Anaerolineae bacterium]